MECTSLEERAGGLESTRDCEWTIGVEGTSRG